MESHQDGHIRPADELNDATSLTLKIGRLEGDATKGGLQLQGQGTFPNMVITPDAVEGLSPEPVRDPSDEDRRLVRNWRLSTFSALPNGKEPLYNEMPGASPEWKAISTERNGFVNISRVYGRPLPEPSLSMAEDDHNFRQEADGESRYWMDARTVGIR